SSLLRIRPPPESTLFPYTTLFRSHKKPQGEGATPMSVQRPSPPANADIEITAELPVLDVAAYEAAASGRPGASSDTWIIPPQPRVAPHTGDGESDIDRTQVVAPLHEESAEPRQAEAPPVEARHVEPRRAEGRRVEPRQTEPPRVEPRPTEARRVEPRQPQQRQPESRQAEPRQAEPPRVESRQAEGRRVEPRQTEPPRVEARHVEERPAPKSQRLAEV